MYQCALLMSLPNLETMHTRNIFYWICMWLSMVCHIIIPLLWYIPKGSNVHLIISHKKLLLSSHWPPIPVYTNKQILNFFLTFEMEKFVHCDGKLECLILYNHYSRPTNLIYNIQFTLYCHYNHKIQCTSTLLCNSREEQLSTKDLILHTARFGFVSFVSNVGASSCVLSSIYHQRPPRFFFFWGGGGGQ